ncbi:MAG: YkgJ family cysteine cluster protein [Sandaracinaceae bacterium]|nr:YkgJ family cysteine cluster protein [Sandaracinaceae bacterium]
MSREVRSFYEDPLDRVWLTAAERMGLSIARSSEVFASTDGRGRLTLGDPSTLDADDCLAQMIFHELCHSLVQGPESFEQIDWGLDNESDRDLSREHGCLRAQAFLLSWYGLERVLAPTTDHRAFYDAIVEHPLEASERSVELARIAAGRSERFPWAPHLHDALRATSAIVHALPGAPAGSLWAERRPARRLHPAAPWPLHRDPALRCENCAWYSRGRCRQAGARVRASAQACIRFESGTGVDCRRCGACCREAYHAVDVGPRERFVTRHPDLLVREDGRLGVRRAGERCAALDGLGTDLAPYTCRVYEDRPRTCRELARASDNCLDARRRVGLSL